MLRGNISANFSFTSIFTTPLIKAEVVYFKVSNYTWDFVYEKLMTGETNLFV